VNILFITSAKIHSINDRAIYPDLLRKFRNEGHHVFILTPTERRFKKKTNLTEEDGCKILSIWTPNLQKTNLFEKTISTLSIEYLFTKAYNKFFQEQKFDLILYSTPPITFTNLIKYIKSKTDAKTYLLLKDIFPQNAVDLKMFNQQSLIYKYFRNKERELYRISDHIGCMSEQNKKYVLKNNPDLAKTKVEVNPNSIFLSFEKEESKSKPKICDFLPKDKVIFVYGGNLGRPQGLDFLLKVIESTEIYSNVFFLIVGSGTESQRISNWFKKNKPINALLIDYLPQEEYDVLLEFCHVGLVFLNPDFTIPNYPSRILSYMNKRLPILFAVDKNTDVGKDAEIGNYGYNCVNGDLSTFKKYIHLLSNDVELRNKMGNNAYNRLKKDFNVDYSYKLIMKHFKP
jgi:glycosyltransferase involved in cell wall biosynthesis